MKRKLLSLFLVLVLVSAALPLPAAADNTGVCFSATNDTLLDLSSAAVYSGGGVYVPSRLFSAFGIYYSYFSSSATGMLYNSSRQIFFDANDGNCYDSNGNYYSATAILHNDQIYVPVGWTCRYFGLTYSFISGIGYGDIVRVKNGSEVLTDSQFLDAATSLMRSRYNEYSGSSVTTPTPASTPAPTAAPVEEKEEGKSGTTTLCFIGLPSSAVLDQLGKHDFHACFFLTAEEISAEPDLVRRAYCAGNDLGVYCKSDPESEFPAAAKALFEVVQVSPTLMTSPSAASKVCAEYGESHACAYYTQRNAVSAATSSASAVTARLEKVSGHITLTLVSGSGTNKLIASLLQYLTTKKFTVLPLLETGV